MIQTLPLIMILRVILTTPPTNDDLILLIVSFLWEHLFILLTQFFCLALILRIVRLFID